MTYYATITIQDKNDASKGMVMFHQAFESGTPQQNRKAAIEAIKNVIEGVKNKELHQAIGTLNVVRMVSALAGQSVAEKTKEILLQDLCYSVYYKDALHPERPMVIESSHWQEDLLDQCRVVEYQRYLTEGYDLGGEPTEVYIPQYNVYLPILAANAENKIGLKQLLLSGS